MSTENVLFVTLDSCRLDVALAACTPNLDSIGSFTACDATATFTLPAHFCFFSSFLPVPLEPTRFLGRYDRLWRSYAARPTNKAVYQWIDRSTVTEHYRAKGYHVHGIGGVQFFDPRIRSNLLPQLFDTFDYHSLRSVEDSDSDDTVLTAAAMLAGVKQMPTEQPFFLFANLSETHYPYVSPDCTRDRATISALTVIREALPDKRHIRIPARALKDLLRPAHMRQVEAVEWIDRCFGEVVRVLHSMPRPTLVIVCSDHGESFGEQGLVGHGHSGPEVMAVPMWVGLVTPG